MVPEFTYLQKLIYEVNGKREGFCYIEIDETDTEISFLANRNQLSLGMKSGLSNTLELQKYHVREQEKLRSNCKSYLRIVRKDGKILKIERYTNQKMSSVYLAYYERNVRYLFPFYESKAPASLYAYATHFTEDGSVAEEYMTERSSQIIYECYTREEDGHVSYTYINYVPNGKYPVLGREAGCFTIEEPLVYVQTDGYVWYQDRNHMT